MEKLLLAVFPSQDWQRYYDDPNKERLLNVISLEFSHTRLENYVQAPRIVRLIDWVDTVWLRHLKDQQVICFYIFNNIYYYETTSTFIIGGLVIK